MVFVTQCVKSTQMKNNKFMIYLAFYQQETPLLLFCLCCAQTGLIYDVIHSDPEWCGRIVGLCVLLLVQVPLSILFYSASVAKAMNVDY